MHFQSDKNDMLKLKINELLHNTYIDIDYNGTSQSTAHDKTHLLRIVGTNSNTLLK